MDSNMSQNQPSTLEHLEWLDFESDSDDLLTKLLKEVGSEPFTTCQSLKKTLEHQKSELEQNKTRNQYIVFTSVPSSLWSSLDNDQRPDKSTRFSYHVNQKL